MKIIFARRRKSFTLLELLVVIAIIVILAALLMPALNTAKEKSRQVLCVNNFKTIYLAHLAYAGDYNSQICAGLETYYWCQRLEREEYIKGKFFNCPTNKRGTSAWMPQEMHYADVDYTRNSELNYIKIEKIKGPSNVLMVGEQAVVTSSEYLVFGKTSYQTRICLCVHGKTGSLLFVDGHTKNDKSFNSSTVNP